MPGVDTLSRIAHTATAQIMGRPMTLTARSGTAASGTIRDYFDAKHQILVAQQDGLPPVSDVAPYAIIRHTQALAAISRAPKAGDHVAVADGLDAGTYEIEDVQPDGSGAYR